VVFTCDGLELTAHGIAPEGFSLTGSGITLERVGDGLRWTRTLREGEIGGVVLESMGGTPRLVTPEEAQQMADDTARFWRGWLHRSSYHGRWREMVATRSTSRSWTAAGTRRSARSPSTTRPRCSIPHFC
jgi:hypothetical protein